MGLIMPEENGDDGVWDTLINDAADAIDAHNHTSGNGARVPSTGININADLECNGWYITELGAIQLNSVSLLAAGTNDLFATAGNLYWRNGSGTNVQITSGSTINAAAIGGIVGDYASVGAEVAFTDSTDTYTFKQQTGAGVKQYARGAFGSVDLYEFKANPTAGVPTTRVRLSSPAALAGSYEITMPAALPGSTVPLQISSAGVVTASNTFVNPPLFTTAKDRVLDLGSPVMTGTAARSASTSGTRVNLGTGGVCYIQVPHNAGEIITTVTIYGDAQSIGSITAELYEYEAGAGTTLVASGNNTDIGAGDDWSITPGATLQPGATSVLTLLLFSTSGATNDIYSVVVSAKTA